MKRANAEFEQSAYSASHGKVAGRRDRRRNRHCPKCQAQLRERWLAARERELLATSCFHVVFTVPHELNVLACGALFRQDSSVLAMLCDKFGASWMIANETPAPVTKRLHP